MKHKGDVSSFFRGNRLVIRALWLLLMTACTACQTGSPGPTGTPTIGPTPTLASASTPSPDEPFTCQSQETSEYVLPFPVGMEHRCIQGYVGRTYHVGVFVYGVDFDMPIGSAVTAAREGDVIFVEASHSDQEDGAEKANVVIVQHDDGTYGRYVHLTKGGALAKIGQRVAQGDPIGLSGSSGDPGMPHLHFDVTKDCPQSNCHTIPICFKNTEPHPAGLVTGESYTAEPY
jgi:murein DD-endopeptidase MepM/ murein hydrolase activator NlpD